MLTRGKAKSFGLIEAVVASMVVVLVLSAAVALASSSLRTMLTSDAYREAEHISGKIFGQIEAGKTAEKISFNGSVSGQGILPISCFDTDYYFSNRVSCKNILFDPGLPYEEGSVQSADGYVDAISSNDNFINGYFKYKVRVLKADQMYTVSANGVTSNESFCRGTKSDITIPADQCRLVEVDVKWSEHSGDKYYYQTEYFTNW